MHPITLKSISSLHSKGNYKQGEKTTLRMGENNSKWNNWQRLISKIYKQLIQLNTRKTKTQSKSVKKTYTKISPKKIYRWLTHTWKDAQYSSLLEKCNSKLQWDISLHLSEWPSSKDLQTIRGYEEKETHLHCWWGCKLIKSLWKTV